MLDKIKSLGADTAVYGVSTIIGRFLNFLLVPFYTNVLSTSQYGIVATVYSYIAFMNIIYIYGMESAYFKYASTREIGNDREIFTTPFISVFITSVIFSSILFAASIHLAPLIQVPVQFADTIRYSAIILILDSMSVVPFAALRLQRKVKLFASVKVINIVVNVASNVVLLVKFHAGIEGIFISGVIASGVTLILLSPTILRMFAPKYNLELFRALLKFGLPYIPAGLAAMMVQVIDRPILLALTNESTVGIYQANYRLGILMMLIVSMYDYAWRPFFLTHANDPNAKDLFSRILTYFTLFSSIVVLLVTLYIDDLVKFRVFGRFIINPAYWSGLGIVPIVLIGYLFNGIYVNLMAGIYIEKKTAHLPYITGIGAAINVIANLLLIPKFGMFGAAWATFLAYGGMAIAIYIVSQKFYPVQYETARLTKIGLSLGVVVLLFAYRNTLFFSLNEQVLKISGLVTFIVLLLILRFPNKGELRIVRRKG
ncbi:MAG TPA: polysaccharide biosynthesis C-terminal domain-containing protein [Candidatus Kryptonia bacterium]